MTISDPRDPFSEVVDQNRRWNPEWYSWLQEMKDAIKTLQDAVGSFTLEEGTWIPVATFTTPGTSSFTNHILSSPRGSYTRIGARVLYTFNFSVADAVVGTASGNLVVTGLPYVGVDSSHLAIGALSHEGILVPGGAQTQLQTLVRSGESQVKFSASGFNDFVNEVTAAHVIGGGGNLILLGSGSYMTTPP